MAPKAPPSTIVHITKQCAESVPFATSGDVRYSDTKLKGFVLHVGKKSKTFKAVRSVRGLHDDNGRPVIRRVTIGRWGHLTVEQARTRAMKALLEMADGKD